MAGNWTVKFEDREDGEQVATFQSKHDAEVWIQSQENHERYDPTGFEVVDGPYDANKQPSTEGKCQLKDIDFKLANKKVNESQLANGVKIWVDDVRPAPNGYLWLKSVNDFIKFVDDNGIFDVEVFDFDHDAGDYAKDGGDYIKCLDYLEFIGADGIKVRIHSANPVGASRMRAVIQKNGWDEVDDIIDETGIEVYYEDADIDESFDNGDYDSLAREDFGNELSEQEDAESKTKVIDTLKKASKDFQKMASNHDPEKFAKIVVAFDDLTAGVGAYDFKKTLKETELDEQQSAKSILSQFMQSMSNAGAKCTQAMLQHNGIVKVDGAFDDKFPLDTLLFRWHSGDEYCKKGWCECTRCMNKWRGVGKEILDKIAPYGIDLA